MRVLFVNDLAVGAGGGTEVVIGRLADALAGLGHEVRIWAGEVSHTGAARALDVWDPRARRQLQRFAEAFRPDVVHHHNVLRELSVSVIGVPSGVPQVLTAHDARLLGVHDQEWHGVRALVARYVKDPFDTRTVRREVTAVAAVSEGLADRLRSRGFPARHLSVPAPPGAPGGPAPSTSETLLFAGRLSPDKGVDVLLDAWPAVLAARPSASLVLVGAGPLLARASALPRVQALGRVSENEVLALLGSARLVVVPSVAALRPEGAPLTAVEAAWAGRPLLVSDDPGLVELTAGWGGTSVVSAGWSAALIAALGSDVDALGEANRLAAEVHAPERCAQEHLALYAELLA